MARLYRFALLLTGSEASAERVLYEASGECAARLGGYRSAEGRMACILGSIRARAKGAAGGGGGDFAGRFAKLPEEERVALAGLYAGLLPAKALAEALKMPMEKMGRVLKKAREHLEAAAMEGMEMPNPERAL